MIIYTSVKGLKLDFLLHKSNEFFPEANRTLTDAKVGYKLTIQPNLVQNTSTNI